MARHAGTMEKTENKSFVGLSWKYRVLVCLGAAQKLSVPYHLLVIPNQLQVASSMWLEHHLRNNINARFGMSDKNIAVGKQRMPALKNFWLPTSTSKSKIFFIFTQFWTATWIWQLHRDSYKPWRWQWISMASELDINCTCLHSQHLVAVATNIMVCIQFPATASLPNRC